MSDQGWKLLSVRLPSSLHAWLSDSAQRNFRSVTAEIAARLDVLRATEEGKPKVPAAAPNVEA
jgi:hypothetical protein